MTTNENCCCPEYYAMNRCDQSCFNSNGTVYVDKTFVDTHSASNTKLLLQTTSAQGEPFDDEDSRNLCWLIDSSVSYQSVKSDAVILDTSGLSGSNFFAGTSSDFLVKRDQIMQESATHDDELWYVVCLCYQNDYDLIMDNGGSSGKIDSDAKRDFFRKKFNCNDNGFQSASFNSDPTANAQCNKQVYLAINTRNSTIDGNSDHMNNWGGTNPNSDPLTIGSFITIAGTVKNSSGSNSAIEVNNTVGGGSASTSATLPDTVAKVIDGPKQMIPGVNYPAGESWGARQIDGYIGAGANGSGNAGTIKTVATGGAHARLAGCSTCLQASRGFTKNVDHSSLEMDDLINWTDADSYSNLFATCPAVWPCRVTFNRNYSIDCSKGSVVTPDLIRQLQYGGEIDSRYPLYLNDNFDTPNPYRQCPNNHCDCLADNADGIFPTSQQLESARLVQTTLAQDTTHSILEAHMGYTDKDGTERNTCNMTNLQISAEYTRNYVISQNADGANACPDAVKVSSPAGGSAFDYRLNSITTTATYNGDAPEYTPVVYFNSIPATEKSEPPVVHANCQATVATKSTCQNLSSNCDCENAGQRFKEYYDPDDGSTNPLITRSIGYSKKDPEKYDTFAGASNRDGDDINQVYVGRIFANRDGVVTPYLRIVKYYCAHDNDATIGKLSGTSLNELTRAGLFAIDEVYEFAPEVQISSGFNVNGFQPQHQETVAPGNNGGRPDSAAYPGSAIKRAYPGTAHRSKITTTDAGTSGIELKGIAHFFNNVCMGLSSFETGADQRNNPAYDGNVGMENGGVCYDTKICDPNSSSTRTTSSGANICTYCVPEDEEQSDLGVERSGKSGSVFTPRGNGYRHQAVYQNPMVRFNGTTTETVGGETTTVNYSAAKYGGNGRRFVNTGLSGDTHEGIQDPWCRGCIGCMATYEGATEDDNYLLLGDEEDEPARRGGWKQTFLGS